MKETIFYLEDRGSNYIYHFFIYNLGGLLYIINKIYNIRILDTSSILLEDKSKIVIEPTTEITFPIKIYMKNILPYQREAFEIIKDKFELVEDLKNILDYEIVSIYGETCIIDGISDNKDIIFPFLRNLFLEKCKYNIIKNKRIFITRKLSQKNHNGVLMRYILNEDEFMRMLLKYNFEYIQLEDFITYNKIKLFMESEIIISTNSSALTFSLFSNKTIKIIEILNNQNNCPGHSHYKSICNVLNLHYNRYSNINEDYHGNFNINVTDFENFLLNLIKNEN